ncbi:hypothetical protein [Vreelandella gomseomensis]|uniref:Uncharacterized protein n=1 Tax=Vreelandella gomseomensis TaxID=370766 RepID=A0ABU1GEE8_9GAMM|nr:hypothetical protein [Halomonas gomseomensis]MDR5875859.1 hypothetical protein [Halomonas gomseomensis]
MLIELDDLKQGAVERLAREEVLAVRVRHFIDEDIAARLSEQIMERGLQKYLNAPSIGRIGMVFYEAENQPPLIANYFESVFDNINELRKRCAPYVSPIDLLRCVLDEIWPAGAQLQTLYGRKMYV